MKIRLDFRLKSAQPHSQIINQFQNLFDAIEKCDAKKSGIYQNILEQEVAKEQQAFHALREELRSARNMNSKRRRNANKKSNNWENVIAAKREVEGTTTPNTERPPEDLLFKGYYGMTIPTTTERPSVDLHDIGYYGTWEQFCDKIQMDQDFPDYFEHDLKTIRQLICRLKESNGITRESLFAFASYKYCLMMRFRFDQLLEEFLNKLSLGDAKNREILLRPGPVNVSICYNQTLPVFTRTCVGSKNPCYKLFRLILGRACNADWLSTKTISSYIEEVCGGKFISDSIDWKPVFGTINYRPPVNRRVDPSRETLKQNASSS